MTSLRATRANRRRPAHSRVTVGLILRYLLLVAYLVFAMLPLAWMLSAAFKAREDVLTVPVQWIPPSWHPENFALALFEPRFTGHSFGEFLLNSTIVATVTALVAVVLSISVGYGFAKFAFRGREGLLWTLLGSTLLPFSSIVIPLFLIIKSMGMYDTLLALIVPFVVSGQAIFISRQFLRGIPDDYLEAARLDGASEFRIFRMIIVPMSGSVVTTVAVMTFMTSWTMFLWPLVVESSQANFTAPLGLSLLGIGATFQTDYQVWMAGATIAILPPLIFFLILERPYMRGLEAMSGLK
ncbi:carbohydrate ABC transporter permease [Microbacterium sp. PMB16]|uniref:carbohydrate ABC transporter permease n=1 Tax=Microbacterium sp. PMB16 TaxID=3120157 RepID=UPI003F4BDD79